MKNDLKIQHDILNELDFEPMINATQISVTVKSGAVTLRGAVRDARQKWVAEWIARKIAGVKRIVNDIEVRLLPRDERSDEELAEAATSHLEWNVAVSAEDVKVSVSRGVVTLEGTAMRQYQKQKVEEMVRELAGVREVVNLITVLPTGVATDVKGKIEEALRRLVEVDEDNIDVEAEDGMVVLVGEARTWSEREEAERVAWCAPGVRSVENRIRVVEPVREIVASAADS